MVSIHHCFQLLYCKILSIDSIDYVGHQVDILANAACDVSLERSIVYLEGAAINEKEQKSRPILICNYSIRRINLFKKSLQFNWTCDLEIVNEVLP